jgi:hypothetical protein
MREISHPIAESTVVLQEREAALLVSHKINPQPIEDCLATLGALLAGPPEWVPPVVTVFAQPMHEGVHVTRNEQVRSFYDSTPSS